MRRRGAASLGRNLNHRFNVPIDNGNRWKHEKIRLRRLALEMVQPAHVLDLCCGAGEMFAAVWCQAASWRGTDASLDKVLRHPAAPFHAPAEAILAALPPASYNLVDIDSYGAPWPLLAALASRRRLARGERLAIVLTDGSVRRAALGLVERTLATMAGVPPDLDRAHRQWRRLAEAALRYCAARMGGDLLVLKESDLPHHRWLIWHGLAVLEGR